MSRKKWTPKTENTHELLQFREKRKWQINLRRYLVEKSPCPAYAPYFGLDIDHLRKWIEVQFVSGESWENFADYWQLDHIVPVSYFDHSNEGDLRLCWNFVNLRVQSKNDVSETSRVDLLVSKSYFGELYSKTGYPIARLLVEKIAAIEDLQLKGSIPQQAFLVEHKDYLGLVSNYSTFEFELLNHGRSIEEIKKEIALLGQNIQH